MPHSSKFIFIGTVFATIVALQGSWTNFFSPYSQTSSVNDAPSNDYGVPMVSQNFHSSINKYINKNIIPGHLSASYRYLMMANHFSRADVALPGFAKYFKEASEREMDNANEFMSYINTRGGYLSYMDIQRPDVSRWTDGVDAFSYALGVEKMLNQELLNLVQLAETAEDSHTTHMLEDKFLAQKVKIIKELGDHLAVLEKMKGDNYGLGEYVFDENL